jgi:hypothetical protein
LPTATSIKVLEEENEVQLLKGNLNLLRPGIGFILEI